MLCYWSWWWRCCRCSTTIHSIVLWFQCSACPTDHPTNHDYVFSTSPSNPGHPVTCLFLPGNSIIDVIYRTRARPTDWTPLSSSLSCLQINTTSIQIRSTIIHLPLKNPDRMNTRRIWMRYPILVLPTRRPAVAGPPAILKSMSNESLLHFISAHSLPLVRIQALHNNTSPPYEWSSSI